MAGRTRFTHFCAVLVAFCSRAETASDVESGKFVGLVFPDKRSKFRGLPSNRSGELPPEAVGGGISTVVFRGNHRPEVVSDVISHAYVE